MSHLLSHRFASSRLVLGSVAVTLMGTTLLTACGGSSKVAATSEPPLSPVLQGDPTQVVAAAAGRTVTSGNAGLSLSVPVVQEGQVTHVRGEGVIDFTADKLSLTVPNADEAEERRFGRTLYMLLPEKAGPALGGKKWVSVDLDGPPSKSPDPFNLQVSDPRQILSVGTAVSNVRLVGHEPVRGAPTVHFAGKVDPEKLDSAGLEPSFTTAFRTATRDGETPTDIWLDDSGQVRRMTLSIPPSSASEPSGADLLTTVELFDFGAADVSFPEPPPSEVADLSALGSLTIDAD